MKLQSESLVCVGGGVTPDLSRKLANMSLFCAGLIVFLHVYINSVSGSISWWLIHFFQHALCGIALPYFFLASGYFLAGHCQDQDWWRSECRKRVKTLLVPYVLFTILYFLWSSLFIIVANMQVGAGWTRNLPLSFLDWLHYFGFVFDNRPGYGPLWFIRALFLLVVLSPLFIFVFQKMGRLALILLGLCWVWGCRVFEDAHLLNGFAMGAFFFGCGLFFRLYPQHCLKIKLNRVLLFCFALLLTFLHLFYFATQNVLSLPLYTLSRLSLLWLVWEFMPSVQLPRYLITSAFPLYLLHLFVLLPITLVLKRYPLPPYLLPCLVYLALSIFVMTITLFLIQGIRRFFPRCASLLFGGR